MTAHEQHGIALMDHMDVAGRLVLDVGCGDGWGAIELKRRGAAVTATDLHKPDSDVIKDVHAAGIPYVQGLAACAGPYDIAWSNHVLEHVPNPIAFLGHVRQLAAELWLCVPKATLEGFAKDHINYYNMPILVEHLRRAGWNVANGAFTVYPGPDVGSLWAVVQPYTGTGLPQYPMPMSALNVEGENHLRQVVHTWNWDKIAERVQ